MQDILTKLKIFYFLKDLIFTNFQLSISTFEKCRKVPHFIWASPERRIQTEPPGEAFRPAREHPGYRGNKQGQPPTDGT